MPSGHRGLIGIDSVTNLLQRRHLEAMVAVSDSGSVHQAARRLQIAQPALSRLVSDAERLLGGTRLFERSSQGSTATRHGEELLLQARFVLRGFERLGRPDGADRPPIRLGCIARAMHTLLPALLENVYPAVLTERSVNRPLRFQLIEGTSTALLREVADGKLDFAIVRTRSDMPAANDLTTERLYDERIVVICSTANQTQWREPVGLSRLAEHEWVLPEPQTGSRIAFDHFWSEHGLPPIRPVVQTRSFETNLALVERTRFLSIAPESIARQHAARGGVRILRMRHPLPASPVTLAFHRLSITDPVLSEFRAQINASAAAAKPSHRVSLRR
jgi:DNA-binding transcriptional LysR family regulator